jgi:hypothetical protein
MKKLFKSTFFAFALLILSYGLTGCFPMSSISGEEQYSNPDWAPSYYQGVRYYYLPDIETYYDLSKQDFVYLNNGQWLFSNTLPPMYSGYDLYNGYEIALNVGVYQPWMHHHFYLSNYPRYYYRSIYRNNEEGNIRGFNENVKKPFYSTTEDRTRRTELSKTSKPEIIPRVTRPPQPSNYYGRNIGQPVRVQPQMRQVRQAAPVRANSEGNQKRSTQNESQGHNRR